MIRFIISLIIFSICMGLGYLASAFPANMFLTINNRVIEGKLISWIVYYTLCLILLYFVFKVLFYIWRTPSRFSRNRQLRKKLKAHTLLKKGLNALIAGNYKVAEKKLAKGANIVEATQESALLFLENAAIAAAHQQAFKRRDAYLLKARQNTSQTNQPLTFLAEAELAVGNKEYQKAKKILINLKKSGFKSIKLYTLLDQCFAHLKDWESAWNNLPAISKQLSQKEIKKKKKQYALGLLNDSADKDSLETLQKAWKSISSDIRKDKSMIILYASSLMENGYSEEAEKVLIQQIKSTKDIEYVQAYSQLKNINYLKALHYFDNIVNHFPDNALFQLSRARLAFNAKEYTAAEEYVNQSIKINRNPYAYALLGQILEKRKQPEAALKAYHLSFSTLDAKNISEEAIPLQIEHKE